MDIYAHICKSRVVLGQKIGHQLYLQLSIGAIPFKIFIPYPDFLVFVSVLLAQKQPKQKVHAYKFPMHMFCKKTEDSKSSVF